MRSMTYRELAKKIADMTDEQKDSDVTIYFGDIDEFFPLECKIRVVNDDEDPAAGILDNGHHYLAINNT